MEEKQLTTQMPEWKNVSKIERPKFPLEIFPERIGKLISEYHDSCGCAIDFAACTVIATVVGTVFDRFSIQVKEDHEQPLTLYNFAIGDSGDNKSGPFKLFPAPLFRMTSKENKKIEAVNINIEEKIKGLKNKLKKKVSDEEKNRIEQEIRKLKKCIKPYYPHMLTDTTLEAIAMEAKQSRECVGVFSSESTVVNAIAGTSYSQRGNTPNIDIVLKGFDAERSDITRIGNSRIELESPRVCMCVAGQKVTLDTLTRVGQQVERGFPNRCLFYIPERRYDHDATKETPIDKTLLNEWEALVKKLFNSERGNKKPYLQLSEDALKRYQVYRNECSAKAEQLMHYGEIKGWISKQHDKMIRLAGILLLMNDPDARTITLTEVEKSIRYFDAYALEMAYLAYGIKGQDLTEQQARFMQRIIDLQTKDGRCTKGSLRERCKSNKQDKTDLDKVLGYLKENDYIRIERIYPQGKGKPIELIHINPYYKP